MPIVYTWEAPLNSPGLEKSSRSNNGLRRTVADRYSILVNREDAHRPPEGEISGLIMIPDGRMRIAAIACEARDQ